MLVITACSSSNNDDDTRGGTTPTDDNGYKACNTWIAETMRSNYLWNTTIPSDSKLDYTASPETFFYTLLSQKDGKDTGSGTSTSHYYYSYIEKNKNYKGTTKGINDDTDSYGIDFVRYSVQDKNGTVQSYEYDRVMFVLPDSPAAKAGLQRGDWITKIDGKDITISTAVYQQLISGAQRSLTVYHNGASAASTITLSASTAVNNDPVFLSDVFTSGTKKIGYLVYNQFSTGPHDEYTDHTYDKELIALFNGKFKDVNEFVLDLRYNPGGYLTCSRLLSRLLVPSSAKESVFCKLTNNKGKSTEYKFSGIDADKDFDLGGFTSLNLSRLFVIATEGTASASEALINGLTPYMTVTKIGLTTEGKNVGSDNFADDSKYAWDIQPITFYITSSAGNDYSSGLKPDYEMNELDSGVNPSMLALGDKSEYLLAKALELINGTTTSPVQRQKAASSFSSNVILKPFGSSLSSHKLKGLIRTPE
jgi:carboxyl-terminal processing protease